jgi:hypothetical protein
MQDPDLRRSRRAGCAALIQCCRVHERSWNAPSSFFYGARLPWPVVRGTDAVLFATSVMVLLTP